MCEFTIEKIIENTDHKQIGGIVVDLSNNWSVFTFDKLLECSFRNAVHVNNDGKGYFSGKDCEIPCLISHVYGEIVYKDESLLSSVTSKGNQIKWKTGDLWVKLDSLGYEGLAEELTSIVLSCTNLKHAEYKSSIVYARPLCQDRQGCVSKDFIVPKYDFITLESLLRKDENLYACIDKLSSYNAFLNVVKSVRRLINLDMSKYLANMLLFDCIVLNEDRHRNNIGVLYNKETKKYECSLIFDNGLSLLSDTEDYPIGIDIVKNVCRVKSKPFSDSFFEQMSVVRDLGFKPIKLNVKRLKSKLDCYVNIIYDSSVVNRAIDVLKYQLDKTYMKAWI
jgi:hypothetical protein